MKTFVKKALSILLALTFGATIAVSALAYKTDLLPTVGRGTAFSQVNDEQNTQATGTGLTPVDERPGFIGFLDMMRNTPVLRILFAPLLGIVTLIYMISVYFAML